MNREIKFRAWDLEQKKMWPDKNRCGLEYCRDREDEFSLMQFTGLKDKNGKEIYEGDVVKNPTRPKDYRLTEVKWDEHLLGWDLDIDDYRYEYQSPQEMINGDKIEVIGNIYENLKLLKCQKD